MQQETPSTQLPQMPDLALTETQEQIIMLHGMDAARHIIETQFRAENKEDQMFAMIFQQGRRAAFEGLLTYDKEKALHAAQQAQQNEGDE